jgi:hypothetical protein
LDYYQEIYLKFDPIAKTDKAAAKRKAGQAAKAKKAAEDEFANKRKCIELKQQVESLAGQVSDYTTPKRRPTAILLNIMTPPMQLSSWVGKFVEVEPDLSPGK